MKLAVTLWAADLKGLEYVLLNANGIGSEDWDTFGPSKASHQPCLVAWLTCLTTQMSVLGFLQKLAASQHARHTGKQSG